MSRVLVERVHRTMHTHGLVQRGEGVVVGVSGGPDSVALLALLVRLRDMLGVSLSVAHVHHGWRGAEADADASFVEKFAARWGLPCSVERVDAPQYAHAAGLSPEDAGRRLRYDALVRTARRAGASVIAVGHTRDDQAETVLMRLLRGSGLAGASGMPLSRDLDGCRLARPLLGVWRAELEAFLAQEGLTARRDASNDDPAFLRNRVRRELLPVLARYNPQVKEALARWAEEAREDYAYLAGQAAEAWQSLDVHATDEHVSVPLAWISRAPLALQRQVLRRAIRRIKGDLLQIEFRHWEALQSLITELPVGARVDLPGGVSVTRQPRALVIARRTDERPAAVDGDHARKDMVLHET